MTSQNLFRAKILCWGLALAVGAGDLALYWWVGGWTLDLKQGGFSAYWHGVLLFGAGCFPLGAGGFAWRMVNLFQAQASHHWPVARGLVLNSRIRVKKSLERGRAGFKYYYYPKVRYEYTVLGKRYVNDTIGFGVSTFFYHRGEAERLTVCYQAGAHVDIHYEPDDPRQSCLRSFDGDTMIFAGRALWAFAAPFGFSLIAFIGAR